MESTSNTWIGELKLLPAWVLPKLPEAVTFELYLPGIKQSLTVTSNELSEPREAFAPLTLDGIEWQALVHGVEAGRFLPEDLLALCEAKEEDPSRRLELDDALAGAVGLSTCERDGSGMSVAELLDRLHAELLHMTPADTTWSPVAAPDQVAA